MNYENFSQQFWEKRPGIDKKEAVKQATLEQQRTAIEKEKLLEDLIFNKGMTAEEAKKELERRTARKDVIKIDQHITPEQKKELWADNQ